MCSTNLEPEPTFRVKYEKLGLPSFAYSLLRVFVLCSWKLTALEYQYQQAGGGLQTNGCGLRSAVPLKVGRGGAQEMNAAVRVSNDANALVERLRAQVLGVCLHL